MKILLSARSVQNATPSEKPFEIWDTDLKGFILRVQPSGVKTYYFQYRDPTGKRRRIRIGEVNKTFTPAMAREAAGKIQQKTIMGDDPAQERIDARLNTTDNSINTLSEFVVQRFAPWVKQERKAGQDTLHRLQYNFAQLMDHPMEDIHPWLIEKWRSEQKKNGKAGTTINRDVAALSSALSKAVDWGLLESHPLTKLKPMKTPDNSRVRYLDKDEEIRLREALDTREADIRQKRESGNRWREMRKLPLYPTMEDIRFADHLKPMVLLAVNTGMRRGEIFSLTWPDINLRMASLTIRGEEAKSGRTRHIPLNDEALGALTAWRNQTQGDSVVFPGKNGEQLNNVRKSWGTVLKLAKITNFRWHDLRHHFASRLVMAGVDLNTVRELMGHADMKMTLRYAHLAPEHKAAAVAKLTPFS